MEDQWSFLKYYCELWCMIKSFIELYIIKYFRIAFFRYLIKIDGSLHSAESNIQASIKSLIRGTARPFQQPQVLRPARDTAFYRGIYLERITWRYFAWRLSKTTWCPPTQNLSRNRCLVTRGWMPDILKIVRSLSRNQR